MCSILIINHWDAVITFCFKTSCTLRYLSVIIVWLGTFWCKGQVKCLVEFSSAKHCNTPSYLRMSRSMWIINRWYNCSFLTFAYYKWRLYYLVNSTDGYSSFTVYEYTHISPQARDTRAGAWIEKAFTRHELISSKSLPVIPYIISQSSRVKWFSFQSQTYESENLLFVDWRPWMWPQEACSMKLYYDNSGKVR